MYTQKFVQTGNSCGAATLMIALHELDSRNTVDAATEAKLYAKTRDKSLSTLLGQLTESEFSSSPINMQNTAKSNGVTAKLYQKDDIAALPDEIEKLKAAYVAPLKPATVNTAGMKALVDKGPLQLLMYVDGKLEAMHWLLLRKDGGKYYLYDTAFGTNQEVNPNAILDFNAQVTTGRQNNFFGIAFHLTKP